MATTFQAREYHQLAELLQETTSHILDSDPILGNVLTAMGELCLSCAQLQTTIEFHQRTRQEATLCKQTLHQSVATILYLLARYVTAVPNQIPESTVTLGSNATPTKLKLWQQVRNLLGFPAELSPPHAAEAITETPLSRDQIPQPHESKKSSLTVYCLGPFRVYVDEHHVDKWPGNKSKSVFKYMVVHHKKPIPQEILMDLFWRNVEPDAARRNLYQAVYQLRQTLQSNQINWSYIMSENGCYGFHDDLQIWLDSEQFQHHYETGQQLENQGNISEAVREYVAADGLYEGHFMGEDVYEEWPAFQRERLKQSYLDCLSRLSDYYYASAQFTLAINYGRKLLTYDNCREGTHRRLMLAYYQQGQRHLALRQYHHCVEALRQELDVVPTPETVQLYGQIQENRVQFSGQKKMNAF